jgi:nucleoside-diphosphate-sugar epimerase
MAELDWRPKVPLLDGIARLCAWIDTEIQPARRKVSAA